MCLSRTRASDSYNNLWLSAWYCRVAVKHQQARVDSVHAVCVRVASLKPVGIHVRACMCVSVNPVCSSLTVQTSLSSFFWTAEASQLTIPPVLLCVRYWGFCDTCKLDKAGPKLQILTVRLFTLETENSNGLACVKNSIFPLPVTLVAARAQPAKSLRAHLRCPRELKLRAVLLAEVGRSVNEAQVKGKLEKGYMSNRCRPAWWQLGGDLVAYSQPWNHRRFQVAPGESSMNPVMTGTGRGLNPGKEELQLTCKCQQY